MKINHLSVSRTQLWKQCEQAYKYRYHLELPVVGEQPIYFTYGSIVHKIAEDYIDNKGKIPINKLAEDVLSGKILLDGNKKAGKLTTEYRNKLVDHLRAIKKISDQLGYDGKTEWEFNLDIDSPNGRFVNGYIDRLIQKDDSFWILDYKTTKKSPFRKGPKDISKDLQLRTYARAVQREFGAKAENIKAALYYVDGAELVGVRFTQDSLDKVEQELLNTFLAIESSDPNRVIGHVGEWCRRCDWRKICPFYSVT